MRCRAASPSCSPAAPLLAAALLALPLPAQGPPANGPRAVEPGWYALVDATVLPRPGERLAKATVVVRDGVITAVGAAAPPPGATVVDCRGLVVHAAFVEPFLTVDVPALEPGAPDAPWHPMVQPQRRALAGAGAAADDRRALRRLGFAAAALAPTGGCWKGQAAVVQLDEPGPGERPRVLQETAYLLGSLQTAGAGHPDSEMGAMALLRQTLADGQWWRRCLAAAAAAPELRAQLPEPGAAVTALAAGWQLPLWFDTQDELQALRLARLAAEFERPAVLVGSGMEFRRLAALAATGLPMVVPLHLPDPPDVATAAAAARVSLRQLQTWAHAAENSKRLLDAGVAVAWTTARLRDRGDFGDRLRDALQAGVTADQALAALTTVPARLLGLGDRLGAVAPGQLANLVVATGEPFAPGTALREIWVGGRRHRLDGLVDRGVDGSWQWAAGWPAAPGALAPLLRVRGEQVTLQFTDRKAAAAEVRREPDQVAFRLADAALAQAGTWWWRLHREGEALVGTATAPDGSETPLRLVPASDPEPAAPVAAAPAPPPALAPLPVPLGGYGSTDWPAAETVAIVGATLWPCDGREPLANGAVLLRDGRIVFAGPRADLPQLPPGTRVVEAAGKHVTPGLIDCHSHTGIARGINEAGEAVTAEVRVADVIDPDDVNWYRQLAGGVTTVNQLHGSANAIGGQSATTKLRYGAADPFAMHLQGAPAGIKFALGENPRRANQSGANDRYPNTRMGVEALLRDRFAAAEAWRREAVRYEQLPPAARAKVLPPRRDLELEALAEVLAGARRIHCHAYRQDEIFMLCGLAGEHGIRIGTFQHVLEGYKVADAIRQAAIGASAFSDWWGFKFEVYDAIPENGAILRDAGVLVSFNSDSNEHARRLNTEAGKAVKYGRVPPHEALCFVTRNPAVQLGIFDRTGSLTAGKDADVALWSGDPLDYAARCEATWVDGRPLWSLARDAALHAAIRQQRHELLQRAAAAGARGRTARDGDPKDAYWAAEDTTADFCCRLCEGAAR